MHPQFVKKAKHSFLKAPCIIELQVRYPEQPFTTICLRKDVPLLIAPATTMGAFGRVQQPRGVRQGVMPRARKGAFDPMGKKCAQVILR